MNRIMQDEAAAERSAAEVRLAWWLCPSCRRKLARLTLAPGSAVEIRCKCGVTATKEAA